MTSRNKTNGPFTGWHMLALMVAFFGVVISVNLTMARLAISTFGGVQVQNSYVASQQFNDWLQEAREERALGWQIDARLAPSRQLAVVVLGAPEPLALTAMARQPLGHVADRPLLFRRQDDGSFLSATSLPPGRWTVRLEATAGTDRFRHEVKLP